MSKHTPGPWQVENDDLIVAANGDAVAKVYLSITVPEIGTYNTDPSRGSDDGRVLQLKANARLIAAAPKLKDALAAMLDFWGGYECPEVDAAIAVMQEIGEDRWSMQAQMDAAEAEGQS
jgi:hypothetical protein